MYGGLQCIQEQVRFRTFLRTRGRMSWQQLSSISLSPSTLLHKHIIVGSHPRKKAVFQTTSTDNPAEWWWVRSEQLWSYEGSLLDSVVQQAWAWVLTTNIDDMVPVFFFSRMSSHTTHMSRALFSSPIRVLTSSSIIPWIPPGGQWMGQLPPVTWSAVCSPPQSQQSLVDSRQRIIFAPNLPTPVSLFSRAQARRVRPTPCPLSDGVGMNICSPMVMDARDSAHLAYVQCLNVSCGGTAGTSCW